MVHNKYSMPGGEDESTRVEEELLRQNDISVESYRVSNNRVAELGPASVAVRAIWSQESYRTIRDLVRKSQSDIVHVQNFFPLLSPAVYYAARHEGAAVVQTLRNYRLICPNALFLRAGKQCEDCMGKFVPWNAVVHRCYRGSAFASAAVSMMLLAHRVVKTWSRQVDTYIALTDFAKRKFVQGGLPGDKIVVKPNFAFPSDVSGGNSARNYFLYVGRLCVEKGVKTLLEAWRVAQVSANLKIVGSGPLAGDVQLAQNNNQIEYLGQCSPREVASLMANARSLIFPSLAYEGMPRIIIEAFAAGTPVIASNTGAMRAMVRDGVTGLHFKSGSAVDLAAKLHWCWEHADQLADMGRAAHSEYNAHYTPERNFVQLISIYQRAIRTSQRVEESSTSAHAAA